MGEAKEKERLRRQHAEKIVTAFENWIESIFEDKQFNDCAGSLKRMQLKDDLIDVLVTPPPK
jgi:hypothetical protein